MLHRYLLLLVLGLMLPGCATITTGTSHNLTVVTEPPGASCELRRGNEVIGAVTPTPGTVTISKSSRSIDVRCRRDGMQEAAASVPPGFQAMTVGNLLLGGIVGIAIDAASGAAGTYPNSVTIAMNALDGSSGGGDELRSIDARIEALRSLCAPAERPRCDEQIRALEADRLRRTAPVS